MKVVRDRNFEFQDHLKINLPGDENVRWPWRFHFIGLIFLGENV